MRLLEEQNPEEAAVVVPPAEDVNQAEWDLEELRRRKEEQEMEAEAASDEEKMVRRGQGSA